MATTRTEFTDRIEFEQASTVTYILWKEAPVRVSIQIPAGSPLLGSETWGSLDTVISTRDDLA